MEPSRNSSVPDRTMLQSLSTHLNHPSKLRESAIVIRRRWLSQLSITSFAFFVCQGLGISGLLDVCGHPRKRMRTSLFALKLVMMIFGDDRQKSNCPYILHRSQKVSGYSHIYIFNPLCSNVQCLLISLSLYLHVIYI